MDENGYYRGYGVTSLYGTEDNVVVVEKEPDRQEAINTMLKSKYHRWTLYHVVEGAWNFITSNLDF